MTVRKVVSALKTAKNIMLVYGANSVSFDKSDTFAVEAYGDYLIDEIVSVGKGDYELIIAMRPVKAGAV